MNKQDKRIAMIVAILIFIAVACRIWDMFTNFGLQAGWLRSVIYIGLFFAWGVSVRNRIIQKQPRGYLSIIAGLMVFWIFIRTIKFHYTPPDALEYIARYLWYLYYLPMLFIPMLTLLVAMSMGKPEDARLPGWTALLYISTAVIFTLVLTNDLHQMVFIFPKDAVKWTSSDYDYGIGYYLVIIWMLSCILVTLAIMLKKCRIPHSRKRIWMPIIPILMLLAYTALYYNGVPWLMVVAGDMTVVHCLMYAATLELCIRCGLIRSNTHYRELFDASTIGAQITDDEYEVYLSSNTARQISKKILRQTEAGSVLLDDGVRLCAAPIHGGHILWQEDISDLLCVLEQLSDTKSELQEYSVLLEKENEQRRRRCKLEEQKRLYKAVQQIIAPAMERLAGLIRQLSSAKNQETEKLLYGKIAVVGAYIKRRSNLVFLSDRTGTVASEELLLCLNESVSNLRLMGIACAVSFNLDNIIDGKSAGMLYDFFEAVVEMTWEKIPAFNVVVTQNTEHYNIMLMLEGCYDLTSLSYQFTNATTEQDEDVCYCRLNVLKGGAAL